MSATPAAADWRALGTGVRVLVTDAAALPAARAAVERELSAIDRACSRFRPDSELSLLNAARGRPRPASALLIESLRAALRAAELTGGDVDPTLGHALVAVGYDRDFAALPRHRDAPPPTMRVRRVTAAEAIEIDPARARVRVREGISLDLGATAKALATDRAVAAAHVRVRGGVLVSVGGDLATAGTPPPGGWRVHVGDDHARHSGGETVAIGAGALASSSTTVRRWQLGAQQMHHVLDPASGRPAGGRWRTVSVAAASCVDANIASTAAIVRGAAAAAWLEQLRLPARLVSALGEIVYTGGWRPHGVPA